MAERSLTYESFVRDKLALRPPSGIDGEPRLPDSLFPHQRALTRWALKRGRAAIFADTGLGKSRMQLAWADEVRRYTNMPVLILAPLAVANQTAAEGRQIGLQVQVCRSGADVDDRGINIINYDRLHLINPEIFGGVVLDESSIIKHHDAKSFRLLTDAFRNTPFRLPATATPAPNDWTELGTHAEFLGICTRAEMLAEFFTHDGGDTSVWRLKGHARAQFWRWVVSWGALIRRPSDLGFADDAYKLPALHVHEHLVEVDGPMNGMLFAAEAQTLTERRDARRSSLEQRVAECVNFIYGEWAANDMEAGVRGSAEGSRGGEPGASRETHSVCERQLRAEEGAAQGVHASLLRGQPGEVQPEDAGAAREAECGTARKVRAGRGVARTSQSVGAGMGGKQPGKEEGAAPAEVQPDAGTACGDVGSTAGGLRDLQDGSTGREELPDGGSLPYDGQSTRALVRELQSWNREVQGQPRSATRSDSVSLEPWIIWCDLNTEQDALERAFGNLAFSIRGADSIEDKESRIKGWLQGERPVIISKPSILGFGLNMQRAARMAFVGVTDSYEAYYQAVRRCWRFGQKREVHVHIFASKAEGSIVANLKRKEREAGLMADALGAETRDAVMAEVTGSHRETNEYNASRAVDVPAWLRSAA